MLPAKRILTQCTLCTFVLMNLCAERHRSLQNAVYFVQLRHFCLVYENFPEFRSFGMTSTSKPHISPWNCEWFIWQNNCGNWVLSRKAPFSFVTSVVLPVCPSVFPSNSYQLPPTGQISVKYGIGDFNENLSRNWKIWLRSEDILRGEELSTFYWCRRHKFAIKNCCAKIQSFCVVMLTVTCNSNSTQRTPCVSTAKFVTRTRHNVALYVHCPSLWIWVHVEDMCRCRRYV
jgi:hypothetical protein